MKEFQNLYEEQANLRIVESLDIQNLPKVLQDMLSLASTPEEQDILLMATLTAASACVPNLYFRYGPTGKKYYANVLRHRLPNSRIDWKQITPPYGTGVSND